MLLLDTISKIFIAWHFIYTEYFVGSKLRSFKLYSSMIFDGNPFKMCCSILSFAKIVCCVWRYSSSQLLLNMFILNEWELSKEGYKTIIPTLSSLELIVYCKDKCVVFSNFSLLLLGGWYCVRKDVDIHMCSTKSVWAWLSNIWTFFYLD